MMEHTLKPCPFCGGKAEVNEFNDFIWIYCSVCESETTLFVTLEQAIEAWNRRVDDGRED